MNIYVQSHIEVLMKKNGRYYSMLRIVMDITASIAMKQY